MNLRWFALVAIVALAPTRARGNGGSGHETHVHRLTAAVDAGHAERLETDHGAVHVWVPAGYHPDGAATIVYVHGYYTDVDRAWTGYQQPEQFALSGLNAVFITCEAPSGKSPPVSWLSLGDLVATVFAKTGIVRPMGPVIAVGHSGAFRTLVGWLDSPELDTVVLIDSDYDQSDEYETWLRASPRHRLIDVTEDTVNWSEEMARDLAAEGESTVMLDRFPEGDRGWTDEARRARLLTVRAQWGHMQLVTGGVVIPEILRLLPVEILADAPWDAPLGDLPPLSDDAAEDAKPIH